MTAAKYALLVVVVEPGHVARARKMLPEGVLILTVEDGPQSLVGRRFGLVLRTSSFIDPTRAVNREIMMRSLPTSRLVVGDLESLAAILGAIEKLAPWVLDGSPGRG